MCVCKLSQRFAKRKRNEVSFLGSNPGYHFWVAFLGAISGCISLSSGFPDTLPSDVRMESNTYALSTDEIVDR